MQDKENVTVVIATHNNSTTIERALRSVTKGIRPANQIIVGDNDSKDNTYPLLCKLLGAKRITVDGQTGWPPEFDGKLDDTPVKIFRKKLSTIGHTLNIAMQMQWQGVTIFAFMDPTSWYAPDKISQAIRIFQTNRFAACVISDCDNHHPDGRVERVFRNSFDMQRMMACFDYDNNFLVRPQIFQKLGAGFNEQLQTREDYEFLLRVAKIGLIYHIPAPLHNNTLKTVSKDARQLVLQSESMIRQSLLQQEKSANG